MASLYIKDPAIAAHAGRVAQRLGTTKTDVVRRGLVALEQLLPPEVGPDPEDLVERIRAWRRDHPLGEPTGLEADKAFYDSLYGEDDDDGVR